jgi:hypothetical protein
MQGGSEGHMASGSGGAVGGPVGAGCAGAGPHVGFTVGKLMLMPAALCGSRFALSGGALVGGLTSDRAVCLPLRHTIFSIEWGHTKIRRLPCRLCTGTVAPVLRVRRFLLAQRPRS